MKLLRMTRLTMLASAGLVAHVSLATPYYVAPTGDDDADGSASAPFRTIARAATAVRAGDVVLVAGGTYIEESITPARSGVAGNYIVFKPAPGTGDVLLQHPATSADHDTPVFQLSGRDYIWIDGFHFRDFEFGEASIRMTGGGEGNVVINNRFEHLGNSGVESWDENSVVWVNNSVRNVICNNDFHDIYGDGVSLNGQGANYNLVCNNTFVGFKGKQRSWGGSYLYSRAVDVQDMHGLQPEVHP